MYLVIVSSGVKEELWVSSIDGTNATKIATGKTLATGSWSADGKHISYMILTEEGSRGYIATIDGQNIQEIAPIPGQIQVILWSVDQKELFVIMDQEEKVSVWRLKADGTNPQKFLDNVFVMDTYPDGKHLLAVVFSGAKTGINAVSMADRKVIPLIPGVATFIIHSSRDGKSFVYPETGPAEILFYKQRFEEGKLIGEPELALKVPFAFPFNVMGGNAYDFSPDLSKIVYARVFGKKDLYLLKQTSE
jgi:Tol biopolymer transport system component